MLVKVALQHPLLGCFADFLCNGRTRSQKGKKIVQLESMLICQDLTARLKIYRQIFANVFGEHTTTAGSTFHDTEVEFPANGFIGQCAGVVIQSQHVLKRKNAGDDTMPLLQQLRKTETLEPILIDTPYERGRMTARAMRTPLTGRAWNGKTAYVPQPPFPWHCGEQAFMGCKHHIK